MKDKVEQKTVTMSEKDATAIVGYHCIPFHILPSGEWVLHLDEAKEVTEK